MVVFSYTRHIFFASFLFGIANGKQNILCYDCDGEKGSNCDKAVNLDQINKVPCEGFCGSVTFHNGSVGRHCLDISFQEENIQTGEFYRTPKEFEEKSWDCLKKAIGKEICQKDAVQNLVVEQRKCNQKYAKEYLDKNDPRTIILTDFAFIKLQLPDIDFKSECVCAYDLCNANAKTSSSGMSPLNNKTSSSEMSPLKNKTSSSGMPPLNNITSSSEMSPLNNKTSSFEKSSSKANCILPTTLWLVSFSQAFRLI